MAKQKVRTHGFKELDRALGDLKKTTAKSVGVRVLKKAGQPIADDAKANAPRLSGDTAESIHVGTKLSRSQKKAKRKAGSKHFAEVHVGPSADEKGHLKEFDIEHAEGQPFMRPAWEGNKAKALHIIAAELGKEIQKAVQRAARRAKRLASKTK